MELLHELRAVLAARSPSRLPLAARFLRPASVLIPLSVREGAIWVLLTERPKDLKAHAGQISFPGGSADRADADAVETALRESEEELGIARADVEVLGALDEYPTVTGYRIVPVVGRIPHPYPLRPSPHEVAEVIEAPLAQLLAPGVFTREAIRVPGLGRRGHVYVYQVGRHRIWGATAAILKQLLDMVAELPSGRALAGR